MVAEFVLGHYLNELNEETNGGWKHVTFFLSQLKMNLLLSMREGLAVSVVLPVVAL